MLINNCLIIVIVMPSRKNYIINELKKKGITNYLIQDAVNAKEKGENFLQNQLVAFCGKSFYVAYNGKICDKNIGALGCFLSHKLALQKAGHRDCVILEDDISINFNVNTDILIPEDTDICYLGGWAKYDSKYFSPKIGINKINSKEVKQYSTYAYYVKSPKLILSLMKKYRPKSLDCFYIAFLQKKIYYNCYYYHPSLISHSGIESIINPSSKFLQTCS